MTGSRDIDSFWQKLNKRPDTKNRTKTKLVPNADSANSKQKSSPQNAQVDHSDHHLLSLTPTSKDTGSAECKDLRLESVEQHIQRPLQMLKDPAAAVRLRGLQSLKVGRCSQPSFTCRQQHILTQSCYYRRCCFTQSCKPVSCRRQQSIL